MILNDRPTLIIVGGFLGAGKTTLILCAANMLRRRGTRVAIITNDQGENLVDTHLARAEGIDAAEIGGGCFCCQFSAFLDAADHLIQYRPDVIFAEPAGSCTDLAATVLRPLQSLHPDRFRVAPFTVVVDPGTASRALANRAGSSMRFLFENQIQEADLLCYSKADLYRTFPKIGRDQPLRTSAATGKGVREWLDMLLAWEGAAGDHTLTIDYDRYAEAEADLSWLNARVEVELDVPASPAHLVGPLLDQLDQLLSLAGATIVHLKLFDATPSSYLKAGLVENGQQPAVEGDLLAPAERRHDLLINLRAIARPELLRPVVEDALRMIAGHVTTNIQAFAPGYPKPEFTDRVRPVS